MCIRDRSAVNAPLCPIFLSGLPIVIPGNLESTKKQEIEEEDFSSLVLAITEKTPAIGALVIYLLVPLIRYSLPNFLAEVVIDIASDPESGSVRANEPIISPVENFGRYFCFCSSVPDITIVCDPIPILVPAIDLNAGEALPNSNVNLTSCSIERFDPPYSVGIEIPNEEREGVFLREIISYDKFQKKDVRLPIALGKSISGKPIVGDLSSMPHLLIAGTTGSGKSVCINTIIFDNKYI